MYKDKGLGHTFIELLALLRSKRACGNREIIPPVIMVSLPLPQVYYYFLKLSSIALVIACSTIFCVDVSYI